MIGEKRVLAVVPARGGSRGLPRKNLRPLLGVPLVARVGDVLQDIPLIDRSVVSTDDDEIARVAKLAGIAAPFRRPPELAGDRIGDWEVLEHALLEMERIDGVRYDIVVMLQPTSPLRRAAHVIAAIEVLVCEGSDAVWTVSETDSKAHPLKQLTIQDGLLDYSDPRGAAVVARQQLSPLYHRNGACYAFTRACLLEQKTIMGRKTSAVVLDDCLVSIDTAWDLALAEFALREFDRP